MKSKSIYILFILQLIILPFMNGQDSLKLKTDSIHSEAILIYKLNKASSQAVERIKMTYPKKYLRKEIEGHMSYLKGDSIITFFWSREGTEFRVKNIFAFQNNYYVKENTATSRIANRIPTTHERALIDIWLVVLKEQLQNTYYYYKPEGIKLFSIIMEHTNGYRAYLLADIPVRYKIVPFGIDYFIEIDKNGKILQRERLHKNYIPTPFNTVTGYEDSDLKGVYHTHLSSYSPLISVTDIFYALLYEDLVSWTSITVVSKGYTYCYDIGKHTITIESWDMEEE